MIRRAIVREWEGREVHIYGVGDTHDGTCHAAEKEQAHLAQTIAADPLALVIGMGDYVEAIAVDDKRFDPRELPKPLDIDMLLTPFYAAAMRFCKIWEPTAGKWLFMIDGNHETVAGQRYHSPVTAWIAERMRAPYVGGADQCAWAIVRMMTGGAKSRRGRFRIFAIHGWGGGELAGAPALKLERQMMRKQADLVLMAHMHQSQVQVKTVEMCNDGGGIEERRVWGVIIPPLVNNHGYNARAGRNAPALGYARADYHASSDSKGAERSSWDVSLREL